MSCFVVVLVCVFCLIYSDRFFCKIFVCLRISKRAVPPETDLLYCANGRKYVECSLIFLCATAARTSAFSDDCKHTVVNWPSLSQVVQELLVTRGLLPDNTDSGQLAVSLRVQAATLPDLRCVNCLSVSVFPLWARVSGFLCVCPYL